MDYLPDFLNWEMMHCTITINGNVFNDFADKFLKKYKNPSEYTDYAVLLGLFALNVQFECEGIKSIGNNDAAFTIIKEAISRGKCNNYLIYDMGFIFGAQNEEVFCREINDSRFQVSDSEMLASMTDSIEFAKVEDDFVINVKRIIDWVQNGKISVDYLKALFPFFSHCKGVWRAVDRNKLRIISEMNGLDAWDRFAVCIMQILGGEKVDIKKMEEIFSIDILDEIIAKVLCLTLREQNFENRENVWTILYRYIENSKINDKIGIQKVIIDDISVLY